MQNAIDKNNQKLAKQSKLSTKPPFGGSVDVGTSDARTKKRRARLPNKEAHTKGDQQDSTVDGVPPPKKTRTLNRGSNRLWIPQMEHPGECTFSGQRLLVCSILEKACCQRTATKKAASPRKK